jgi:hypothetical protein
MSSAILSALLILCVLDLCLGVYVLSACCWFPKRLRIYYRIYLVGVTCAVFVIAAILVQ